MLRFDQPLLEEIKQNYNRFKRVLVFTEMHKDVFYQFPKLKVELVKMKALMEKIDENFLDQGDENLIELINSKNILVEYAKYMEKKEGKNY